MGKISRNAWTRAEGAAFEVARVLRAEEHPEGLDADRLRFLEPGRLVAPARGQILSIFAGRAAVDLRGEKLALARGAHLYVPPGTPLALEAEAGTELMCLSAPEIEQARGAQPILRDETFVRACAAGGHALRWILTPQYLSRRIFLHHDATLLSRSGNPVSWFRTTMFDVVGLPPNQDGEPAFKMSYNSRTEWNGVYEVEGDARARFARHPYGERAWEPWTPLDGDSVYHLDEVAGGRDEESYVDAATGRSRTLRNRHEVHVARGGQVSLFCLFDPAPTGVERHRPGEYSDYEPLADVLETEAYAVSRREIARFDAMVERLSWAMARGQLESMRATPEWALYTEGLEVQRAIEAQLERALISQGDGRERVVEPWMIDRRQAIP